MPQSNEPATIIAGKKNSDGNIELRMDSVARAKPKTDGTPGAVDIKKTKAKAKDMINKQTGVRLPPQQHEETQTNPTGSDRKQCHGRCSY